MQDQKAQNTNKSFDMDVLYVSYSNEKGYLPQPAPEKQHKSQISLDKGVVVDY
jgi:hypothetical protein